MDAPITALGEEKKEKNENVDDSLFHLALNKKVEIYFIKPIGSLFNDGIYQVEGIVEKIKDNFILFKKGKERFIFNINNISSLKFLEDILI